MLKKDLLHRYRKGRVTPLEKELVEEWYAGYDEGFSLDEAELERRLQRLDAKIQRINQYPEKRRPLTWVRWTATVAASLIVAFLVYYQWDFFSSADKSQPAWADVAAPVGDRATVTLQNNTQISLDAIERGDTVTADGYWITRRASGEIQYIALDESSPVVFNTIETSIGGGTTIILSDGTKVWLNANSKVTYPAVFASDMREIYLKGEGYFEVVSSQELQHHPPFFVKTDAHTLRVYGTRFNINAYQDNYIATLLEGKIGLRKEAMPLGMRTAYQDEVLLKPSQQYIENARTHIVTLTEPDQVLDWKNGYFYLTDQTLAEVSDKLSRWYGVTFVMDESATQQKFFGQISRKKNLSEVLNLMEEVSALSFRMENKTVFVEHKEQN